VSRVGPSASPPARPAAAAPPAIADVFNLLAKGLAVDSLGTLDCGFVRVRELALDDEVLLPEAAPFERFLSLLVC